MKPTIQNKQIQRERLQKLNEYLHPTREDRSFEQLYGNDTLTKEQELDEMIPPFVKKLFENIIDEKPRNRLR